MKRSRLTVSILSLSLAVLVGAAGIFGGAGVVAAEETQTVTAEQTDLTDEAVKAFAASGISLEEFQEILRKQNKKISPRQMQLFLDVPIQHQYAQHQKSYKEAVESAQLIVDGKVKASEAEKKAAEKLLQVKASFGNKEVTKFTSAEIKQVGEAASAFNSEISADLKTALKAYKENPNAEGQGSAGDPAPSPSPAPTDTTETAKVTGDSGNKSDKRVELLDKTTTLVTPDNPFMARFAAEPSDLTEVEVDGEKLNRGRDYIVTRGSTIITLTKNYVQTLSAGEHTLTAEFTNSVGTASFVVADNLAGMKMDKAKKQVAKTGELATSVGAGFMGIISLLGAAVIKGKKDKLVK